MVKYYYYPKEGIIKIMLLTKVLEKKFQHMHITTIIMENLVNLKEAEITTHLIQKDIVSETQDGYVVRHGDHFHYIKKSELSASQLSQAKESGVNPSLASSAAGVTTPTSDGYIFKGESDIIGRNSFGL